MYFWSIKSISLRQAYMKTQPPCTIYNGQHILKVTEIACKIHVILSISEKGRNKKIQNTQTQCKVFTWKLQMLGGPREERSLLPIANWQANLWTSNTEIKPSYVKYTFLATQYFDFRERILSYFEKNIYTHTFPQTTFFTKRVGSKMCHSKY